MEKKITKRDCINTLMNMEEVKKNADCMAYLENELKLLDNRKNGTSEKAKAKAAVDKQYIEAIKTYLESCDEPVSATNIVQNAKGIEKEDGTTISVQKVSSLITVLLDTGAVVRLQKGRSITYCLADKMPKEEVETVAE